MSYQFIHVDSFARAASKGGAGKWSAAAIAGEAERDPNACPHVSMPQPPRLVFGDFPRFAVAEATAWADQAKDASGRKLRKDGNCLLAGVISFPADRPGWPQFLDAAVAWLQKKYGGRLRSVIEHRDETYPHLHFYAVPRPGERFGSIHQGKAALDLAAAGGASKKEQNQAYREAMRAFQDEFSEEVAGEFGLLRLGPRRQRFTRSEWHLAQEVARLESENAALKKGPGMAPERRDGDNPVVGARIKRLTAALNELSEEKAKRLPQSENSSEKPAEKSPRPGPSC